VKQVLVFLLILPTTWIAFLFLAGLTGLHAGMETKIWIAHSVLTALGALVTRKSPIEVAVGGPAKLIAYFAAKGKSDEAYAAVYRLSFTALQIVFTPLASTLVQPSCERAARHLQ
jgi:hypothetical protein